VIQPYRWLTFRGFLRHLSDLDDSWRWRFMRHVLAMREGFPQPTYDRCAVHDNFDLRSGCFVQSGAIDESTGGVLLQTNLGPLEADFVISATGIENDFHSKPELASCAHNIATWGDRYTPPADEVDTRLATYPYLNADWSFAERVPGKTAWLRNVHLYAIGSTMSFGASGSSINAMTTAVPKLVAGLTRGLFEEDLDKYWASFQAYDVPQAVIPHRTVKA
jgi:hypothetical protein